MYNTSLNIKILIISGVWILFQNSFNNNHSKFSKPGKEINLVIIDVNKAIQNPGTVTLNEIADSIQYVLLKEKPGNYINSKISFKLSKNYLFVNDLDGIKQFSLDGSFIRQIGKKGKGPQEYLHISDFSIDEVNRQIFILSVQTKQLLIYSFEGKFIKSVRGIDDTIDGICNLKSNRLLLHRNNSIGTNDYNFFITNNELIKIKTYKNYNKFMTSKVDFMGRYLNYYKFNNFINIKDINDTLFTFEPINELLIPRALFLCSSPINSSFKGFNMANLKGLSRIPHYYNICETKSYLFFSFSLNRKKYNCFYSFENKKEYFLDDKLLITNDIDHIINFWPEFQLNNQLVMLIQSDKLLDGLDRKNITLNLQNQEFIKSIPEEGWILMIVKLKK